MSTLVKTAQVAGVIAAACFAGTVYVLVHEHRRKAKKVRRLALEAAGGGEGSSSGAAAASSGLSAAKLIEILTESSIAAYQLIEQTRKAVHEKHVATNRPLEDCVDELQKNFESSMEVVLGAVRQKHGVSEQLFSEAMQSHSSDPAVKAAVEQLRDAMTHGKPPPNYREAVQQKESDSKVAKMKSQRKTKRKG